MDEKDKNMKFDLEKLRALSRPRSQADTEAAVYRKKNRKWLRISQEIALLVRQCLRAQGMCQKDLAMKLGVSPAYVGKLLKGQENLTLESISALEEALGTKLIYVAASYTVALTPHPYPAEMEHISESEVYRSDSFSSEKFPFDGNAA